MSCSADKALCTLIEVFQKYAGKGGDRDTLNKSELKEVIKKELLGLELDDSEIQDIMEDLDRNKDDVIDLQEYFTMLGALAVIYKVSMKC